MDSSETANMNTQTLVRIHDGARLEGYVTDLGSVYPITSITKKGIPNANHSPIGWMATKKSYFGPSLFAPYNAYRESAAGPVRQQISVLRAQINQLEEGLMAVYRKEEATQTWEAQRQQSQSSSARTAGNP